MNELWGRATTKFAHVLTRMPQLTRSGFGELLGGELLAVRISDGWEIRSEDDPSRINPRVQTVYLSKGREIGEPNLAFEAVNRLSRILYETTPDLPEKVHGSLLVAATWYFPEWDWYINRPIHDSDGEGFPTTKGMWGHITGNNEYQAEGIVIVCDAYAQKSSRERKMRIRQGGWPTPKDWSPKGRLPGEY